MSLKHFITNMDPSMIILSAEDDWNSEQQMIHEVYSDGTIPGVNIFQDIGQFSQVVIFKELNSNSKN